MIMLSKKRKNQRKKKIKIVNNVVISNCKRKSALEKNLKMKMKIKRKKKKIII